MNSVNTLAQEFASNTFELVVKSVIESKLYQNIKNSNTLIENISILDRLLELNTDTYINILFKGLLYFGDGMFSESAHFFDTYSQFANEPPYLIEFAKYLSEKSKYNSKYKREFIVNRSLLKQNKISLIGCSKDYNRDHFYWPVKFFYLINTTDLGIVWGFARRNITYLNYSFYYENLNFLLESVLPEQKYLIFSCHSNTDDPKNPIVKFDFKKGGPFEIPFSDFYSLVRKRIGSDTIIVMIGCNLKLTTMNYQKVIYCESFINEKEGNPFVSSFFRNAIYSEDYISSFYLARVYTSMFSERASYMRILK